MFAIQLAVLAAAAACIGYAIPRGRRASRLPIGPARTAAHRRAAAWSFTGAVLSLTSFLIGVLS